MVFRKTGAHFQGSLILRPVRRCQEDIKRLRQRAAKLEPESQNPSGKTNTYFERPMALICQFLSIPFVLRVYCFCSFTSKSLHSHQCDAVPGSYPSKSSGWGESDDIQPAVDSGLVAGNKVPQLLDYGVDQLLLVTLILTELSEHVVFPISVLHPTEIETERDKKEGDYINRYRKNYASNPYISVRSRHVQETTSDNLV